MECGCIGRLYPGLLDLTRTNYISEVNLQAALDSTSTPFLIGQANSPALNDFVAPVLKTTDTSRLAFVHLGALSDSLFALPGRVARGSVWGRFL